MVVSMFEKSALHLLARAGCFAGVIVALASGSAAKAGPYVVPGVGPQDFANGYAEPAPQQARPVRVAAQGDGYGGGLLEMLVTGVDPSAPQVYAPAARTRRQAAGYAPQEPQRQIDPIYYRTEVDYPAGEQPGSIIVDTSNKFLYFVKGAGRAIRYGIGVGRPGFEWSGVKTVSRKAEWPDWTPPAEMLARRPDLPRFMPGGPANPLGARALYLGSSLYRIHGTNEPHTIGQNVSSGCIRMMNEDVTDLYERVAVGTRVVVR